MERIYGFPEEAKHFYLFGRDVDIKQHHGYTAAKAGDEDAATNLIWDLSALFLERLRGEFLGNVTYVAPFAKEASGDNAIPQLLSSACSIIMGGRNDEDIVQVTRVFHTGADPMERMNLRASFEGNVVPGASYVLVDDVTSMGGTLAELSNYIRISGGVIVGSVVLANAGRIKYFIPNKNTVRLLRERYENEIKELFGIHVEALTANEADYLIGFRSFDEIRNRRIKAEEETTIRLRSKGIQRAD